MGNKYKRARSVASSKGWSKAGFASAGSTRASRSRAAASAARRGVVHSKRSTSRYKAAGGTGAKSAQPIGAAKFLVSQQTPPSEPVLHSSLAKLGISVPKFHLFQSIERFHVQPTSGHCHWAGVPYLLKQGTVVAVPGTDTDYVPNNCDLFDCARKLVQGYKDNMSASYTPFPIGTQPFTSTLDTGAIQSTSTTVNSSFRELGKTNHRRFNVAKNKVYIVMENISSLDAFVEQYELTYTAPALGNPWLATTIGTQVYSNPHLFSIGSQVGTNWVSNADAANSNNAPRLFNTYQGEPYYPEVHPTKGELYKDIRRYGTRMAGQMLESYASIMLNHRDPAAAMDMESKYVAARTADVTTVVKRPTIPEVLSHPMNDPCKIIAPGVRNKSGFSLRRLPGLITLKPGQGKRVLLPVKNQFSIDVDEFPRTADVEADAVLGLGLTSVYRDIATLPRTMKIRYFRVRGDMINDKNRIEALGDADYQTGSCRVQFQVMRSLYMKHVVDWSVKVAQPYMEFDDVVVAPGDQQAINDESDAPAVIGAAGAV